MKRAIVLAAAVVVALGAAGIALSNAPGSQPEDRVYGGAHSEGPTSGGFPLLPRDASIDAHSLKNGKAYGAFRAGRNAAAEFLLEARITCVSAVGNKALVGGIITADNFPPPVVGEDFLWYAIDNGGPGGTSPDRESAIWRDADGSLGQGSFPTTFPADWPNTCPAADAAIAGDTTLGHRAVQGGDLVVIDGT
jgi:hypothetical protein